MGVALPGRCRLFSRPPATSFASIGLAVWYAKYRLPDGSQVQRKVGPAWTERGRPPAGYVTKRPRFGAERIEDITPAKIEEWRGSLRADFASRTKNKLLFVLSAVFQRAQRVWGLPLNPVAGIEKCRQRSSGDIDVFSPGDGPAARARHRLQRCGAVGRLSRTAALTRRGLSPPDRFSAGVSAQSALTPSRATGSCRRRGRPRATRSPSPCRPRARRRSRPPPNRRLACRLRCRRRAGQCRPAR